MAGTGRPRSSIVVAQPKLPGYTFYEKLGKGTYATVFKITRSVSEILLQFVWFLCHSRSTPVTQFFQLLS